MVLNQADNSLASQFVNGVTSQCSQAEDGLSGGGAHHQHGYERQPETGEPRGDSIAEPIGAGARNNGMDESYSVRLGHESLSQSFTDPSIHHLESVD